MTDTANDTAAHADWGRRTNGRCWDLLAKTARTQAEDRELVDVAHASLWHWRYGGTRINEQRGEWMVSHVYAVLGNADAAMRHAQRCWEITEADGLGDFDLAYAYEGLYRAATVLGDVAAAGAWRVKAAEAGAAIARDEDRSIFDADLAAEW